MIDFYINDKKVYSIVQIGERLYHIRKWLSDTCWLWIDETTKYFDFTPCRTEAMVLDIAHFILRKSLKELGQDEYLMIDDTKQVKYDKNSKEIWKNY